MHPFYVCPMGRQFHPNPVTNYTSMPVPNSDPRSATKAAHIIASALGTQAYYYPDS